jgi:hypothetical protein
LKFIKLYQSLNEGDVLFFSNKFTFGLKNSVKMGTFFRKTLYWLGFLLKYLPLTMHFSCLKAIFDALGLMQQYPWSFEWRFSSGGKMYVPQL